MNQNTSYRCLSPFSAPFSGMLYASGGATANEGVSIMPEKDLVLHNVEQDTVQIYLSEERGLTPLLQVVSSWRIHTCQALSLSIYIYLLLSIFLNTHSFPRPFFEWYMLSSVSPLSWIFQCKHSHIGCTFAFITIYNYTLLTRCCGKVNDY